MKCKDLWLLMGITFNLEHGPHGDQERRNQMRECLRSMYDRCLLEQLPLFREYAPKVVDELEREQI